MSGSFEEIMSHSFTTEPSEWEVLDLAKKFPYLDPASNVAAKVLEVHQEFCAAATEYDQACEKVRQGDENIEVTGLTLQYALGQVIHNRMRYDILETIHSGICLRTQPNSNPARVGYGAAVDEACSAEMDTIAKHAGRFSDTVLLDLTQFIQEVGALYHTTPDCLLQRADFKATT